MRTIARSTGARVTGVTISPYQIERGRAHNRGSGLDRQCTFVEADFNHLPFESGRFDGAYTIAACCHAGDRRGPFAEVLRVLRPGARFVGSDWCMTHGQRQHERHRAEHAHFAAGVGRPEQRVLRRTPQVLASALAHGDDDGEPRAPVHRLEDVFQTDPLGPGQIAARCAAGSAQ